MSEPQIPQEILNLSPIERIALATSIWESVADEAIELSEEHKRILDARIAEADASPDAMIPAEDVFRLEIYRSGSRACR